MAGRESVTRRREVVIERSYHSSHERCAKMEHPISLHRPTAAAALESRPGGPNDTIPSTQHHADSYAEKEHLDMPVSLHGVVWKLGRHGVPRPLELDLNFSGLNLLAPSVYRVTVPDEYDHLLGYSVDLLSCLLCPQCVTKSLNWWWIISPLLDIQSAQMLCFLWEGSLVLERDEKSA